MEASPLTLEQCRFLDLELESKEEELMRRFLSGSVGHLHSHRWLERVHAAESQEDQQGAPLEQEQEPWVD